MKSTRNRLSRPIRILLCICLILGVLSVLLVGLSLKIRSLQAPFNQLAFDSGAWQTAHTKVQKERRAKMVNDLTRNYLRAGMHESRVIELLGTPEREGKVDGYSWTRPPRIPGVYKILQYKMGSPWMDMAGEDYLLQLYFDNHEQYLSYSVETD